MTNIHLRITSSPASSPDIYRTLHDYESNNAQWPYYPRVTSGPPLFAPTEKNWKGEFIGLPETIKLLYVGFEKMTRPWQELNYALLSHFAPSYFSEATKKQNYASVYDGMKFVTNKHGVDEFRDYINDTNTGMEDAAQENVITAGWIVKAAGNVETKIGQSYLPILCLDRDAPPPSLAWMLAHEWAWFPATTCRWERIDPTPTADCPNGTFRVDGFHDNDGGYVAVPLVSRSYFAGSQRVVDGQACNVNYVLAARVRR